MSRSKKTKNDDTGRGKYLCLQLKHTSHVGDSYEHCILSDEMRRGQSTDKPDKSGGRVCIFRSKKTDQTVFLLAISPSRLQECCTLYLAKPPKQYFSLLLRGGSLKGDGRGSRKEWRHFSRMATKKKEREDTLHCSATHFLPTRGGAINPDKDGANGADDDGEKKFL